MSLLGKILEQKRADVARLGGELPTAPPKRSIDLARRPGAPLALIAEIKRRSPSAGALSTRLSVAERAQSYERAGARALSVLTDETFFGGSFADLAAARAACSLPILCKDFVIDERQLDAASAHGADLVLLIVRCLPAERLAELHREARARSLVPLVEVTSSTEAELALSAGASLIGVNARDLDTLAIDRARAARVLDELPADVVAVHLSGLARPEDVARVARSRSDAALVGEALMREDDPLPLLSAMVAAADEPGTLPMDARVR
jgi:indole-3-glycerol phosphate synthase